MQKLKIYHQDKCDLHDCEEITCLAEPSEEPVAGFVLSDDEKMKETMSWPHRQTALSSANSWSPVLFLSHGRSSACVWGGRGWNPAAGFPLPTYHHLGCLLPVHSLLEKSGGIIKCLHHSRHDFANAMVFENMEVIVDGHSAVFQRHGFDETHTAVGGVDGIRQLRHTAAATESEMRNANACHIGPGRRKEEIVALVEHEMPTSRQHTVYAAVTATDFLYDMFLYIVHDAMVR